MTNYKLIMLPNPILVSDEDIHVNDFFLVGDQVEECLSSSEADDLSIRPSYPKIVGGITTLPSINFSLLSEEDCNKIGWIDVDKFNKIWSNDRVANGDDKTIALYENGFIDGFKTSQELNNKKFTELDMIDFATFFMKEYEAQLVGSPEACIYEFTQLISQPKVFNVEIQTECAYGNECPSKGAYDKQHLCKVQPKITNNTITITKVL